MSHEDDDEHSTSTGIMLAIAGTFLFALKSIFIKLAFASGASPALLLALRLGFSFPIYLVIWIHLRRNTSSPISFRHVVFAVLLGFWGYYMASFLDLSGLELISAQLERITLFTYPAMIAVLAWMFLGEKLSPRIILAISLCYAGVLLMYLRERHDLTSSSHLVLGIGLVIASAASYSLYIVLAKPMMQRIGSREFTSLAMMGSGLFIGLHVAWTTSMQEVLALPTEVYLYGIILAIVCTVLPSYMINEAIVRIGATRTTLIGTVGPVLTMLLAISVLGEPSSLQHFLGMAIAVAGVSLVTVR